MNLIVKHILKVIVPYCMLLCVAPVSVAEDSLFHDIAVVIKPQHSEMDVKDRITLPTGVADFVLTEQARDLKWKPAGILKQIASQGQWRFALSSPDARSVELTYTLPFPRPDSSRGEMAAQGIVLDGKGPWYAEARGHLHTFTMSITSPQGWRAVSQGQRLGNEPAGGQRIVIWREMQPQEEIYLVADRFEEYENESDGIQLMAFLRKPDQALAHRYLELTGRYIEMYERLIGEYPYAKFALVENSWESGYGMPSFTLLGPRVIRLPFIPYTSYPHEILHNWWGNSVYVDYEHGNWSEGLTSYLADHWLKEQRGEGARYRRDTLQKYRNFAAKRGDFPLSQFRARHGDASQAVGYGKSLMLFHMLRKTVGDDMFFDALRRFYRDYRFKRAAFSDLRNTFEQTSGRDMHWFFEQWLRRTGAPKLKLDNVVSASGGDRVSIRGLLRQTQSGAAYKLEVPVRVSGAEESLRYTLELDAEVMEFELRVPDEPISMIVDPDFDVFRELDAKELPPTLGEAIGAERLTFVIPGQAGEAEHRAYQSFIAPWRKRGREVRTVTDGSPLPKSGAIWVLGWDNIRRHDLEERLRTRGVKFDGNTIEIEDAHTTRSGSTVMLSERTDDGRALVWTHLSGTDPGRIARRLAHYGRISYIAFRGEQLVMQGQWPVVDSPLQVRFP